MTTKRIKTVFTNKNDVAHLWANKRQESARTSNFYFDRNTIYSYGRHFPIAKHVEFNGKAAILFTYRGYSNTTSKHISSVYMASNHIDKIYCYNPEYSHEENLKQVLPRAEAVLVGLSRAKKPEIYLNQLSRIETETLNYCNFFEIPLPEILRNIFSVSNKAEYLQYAEVKSELQKAENLRVEKELKKRHKKELAKWRNFETRSLHVRDGWDYLRFNIENQRVETTQGIEIPKLIAVKFYEWMQKTIQCIDCDKEILGYKVTELTKDFIKIGCHKISIKEAKSIYNLIKS